MVVSLNQTQQERVYNSFHRTWYGMIQMDEATRRKQLDYSRGKLQLRVSELNLQSLHLQEAMIEYLLMREHEEALQLPPTPVPVILLLHFQSISYPALLTVVNRLAVFPSSDAQVTPPQSVHTTARAASYASPSQEAKYQILIDSYNAVRDGRITSPETIRELARLFFEIENDPEANKNAHFDAGRAAHILVQRAKLYESRANAGNINHAGV